MFEDSTNATRSAIRKERRRKRKQGKRQRRETKGVRLVEKLGLKMRQQNHRRDNNSLPPWSWGISLPHVPLGGFRSYSYTMDRNDTRRVPESFPRERGIRTMDLARCRIRTMIGNHHGKGGMIHSEARREKRAEKLMHEEVMAILGERPEPHDTHDDSYQATGSVTCSFHNDRLVVRNQDGEEFFL